MTSAGSLLNALARALSAAGLPVDVEDAWVELHYGEYDGVPTRDVPAEVRASDDAAEGQGGVGSLAGVGLDKLEKEAIRQTLAMTAGNREQAAQMLGIGERTLYRKLKEYGLR